MERRLIVMRHAKSSWASPGQNDFDRPLNKRGQKAAPAIAARLAELGWLPERVVSSSAARTRETCHLMEPIFEASIEIGFFDALYHAGLGELRPLICEMPDEVKTILAIGHNPGWEGVVRQLSGESITMTTANAALLSREGTTWEAALSKPGAWNLEKMLRPKEV